MTRSDAIVRRQLLKAGLILAGAPFCPEALFDGRAAGGDEKPAEDAPIGPREIVKGLDGMSRVVEKGNVFGLGHNAAAVISSAFFCREQRLGADTQKEILAFLDARLLKNPIYAAPRPKGPADPKLVEGLLEDLDGRRYSRPERPAVAIRQSVTRHQRTARRTPRMKRTETLEIAANRAARDP